VTTPHSYRMRHCCVEFAVVWEWSHLPLYRSSLHAFLFVVGSPLLHPHQYYVLCSYQSYTLKSMAFRTSYAGWCVISQCARRWPSTVHQPRSETWFAKVAMSTLSYARTLVRGNLRGNVWLNQSYIPREWFLAPRSKRNFGVHVCGAFSNNSQRTPPARLLRSTKACYN
jgi:hypothetical protein